MSYQSLLFRLNAGKSDRKRDRAIPLPLGVTECRNITYGPHGHHNQLDVYFPEGTRTVLPAIVSIHGGGYVYGSKDIYRRYCMDLAKRGFTVVNFNYRLAPKWKFPAPLEDTNAVMTWLWENAAWYHVDPAHVFLIGDSAGAQLASQYAAIWANPEYARLFSFRVPEVTIRALGLNCGLYDMAKQAAAPRSGLALDYLGRKLPEDDPRLDVLGAICAGYPPAHITTACHDFLRENAQPMRDFLSSKGICATVKCYGSSDKPNVAHVFHVNIALEEATQCNDDQCEFFRKYL